MIIDEQIILQIRGRLEERRTSKGWIKSTRHVKQNPSFPPRVSIPEAGQHLIRLELMVHPERH